MKNITALALAALTAGSAYAQTATSAVSAPAAATPSSDISVAGRFGWSDKNVYLGKTRSDTAGKIQSTVTVESAVPGFAGVNAYVSYYSADNFERSLALGAKTEWTSVGTVEFGVSRSNTAGANAGASIANNDGYDQADRSRQVYAGLKFSKVALAPTAYLYYDTDLKQTNFVVSANKDFEGKDLGVPGFDLETKAYLGLVDSKAATVNSVAFDKNSYVYLGASADVTRRIGTGAKVGLGLNWAYNTDGQIKTSGSSVWLKAYANFKF
jgi:hypothetical protein